jgi:hypothetical protein
MKKWAPISNAIARPCVDFGTIILPEVSPHFIQFVLSYFRLFLFKLVGSNRVMRGPSLLMSPIVSSLGKNGKVFRQIMRSGGILRMAGRNSADVIKLSSRSRLEPWDISPSGRAGGSEQMMSFINN